MAQKKNDKENYGSRKTDSLQIHYRPIIDSLWIIYARDEEMKRGEEGEICMLRSNTTLRITCSLYSSVLFAAVDVYGQEIKK